MIVEEDEQISIEKKVKRRQFAGPRELIKEAQ
jgi:hypothetical protein